MLLGRFCRRLFVSDELEGVKQLLDRIRRVTFGYVQDAFDLARVGDTPATLDIQVVAPLGTRRF